MPDASNNTWAVQYLLRANGLDLPVDGTFGPQTRDKVIVFQKDRNLTVDGMVGSQTWMALTRDADQTLDGVRAIQSRLLVQRLTDPEFPAGPQPC